MQKPPPGVVFFFFLRFKADDLVFYIHFRLQAKGDNAAGCGMAYIDVVDQGQVLVLELFQ